MHKIEQTQQVLYMLSFGLGFDIKPSFKQTLQVRDSKSIR